MSSPPISTDKPPRASALAAIRKRWRGWLRAIHRDVGYLAVGLTLVYAISGLAINHIKDWDPNYTTYERERTIAPIPADVPDDVAIAQARAALKVGTPRSTYRAGDEIYLEYDYKKLVVYGDSGRVVEQGRHPRFLLRVANWLHYNRGKQAWTYIADGYAVLLLYLAVSGLFMIKGKNGLRWRGAILLAAGISVPIGYVSWSGGPEAANRATQRAAEQAPPVGDDAAGEPADPPAPPSADDEGAEFTRPPARRPPPPPRAPGPDEPAPVVDAVPSPPP
ncbi:MAG: hypothetical protein IPH44_19505 [Myxococcales bacterium]|jgi:hypothetical protein|nr:hypothetical protein [Myxococcales bacterium]MBK7195036.1 hypothetical protein [Myxococcales bacterium]MBP6842442.1 hypothetical protein [Kofleriaceae bacterium]